MGLSTKAAHMCFRVYTVEVGGQGGFQTDHMGNIPIIDGKIAQKNKMMAKETHYP